MGIFKGLLSQLLSQCQELVPYCYDKRITSGDATLNSASLMELLLRLFCEKIPQIFIVIDGLDECAPVERKVVLTLMNNMVEHCDATVPGKLRVLFVSQFYKDIEKALMTASTISLTSDDNKTDIKEFVFAWSDKIQQKHGLDPFQVGEIRQKTCIRADGNV
jgi:hypothetical protein